MSRSVYVVDDDDGVRISLHALLSVRTDLVVRGFRSGTDFVEALPELSAGIVLLDFHMPGLSGLDVLCAIEDQQDKFGSIVLTGQGNIEIAVEAMKRGAIDFIEKPYQAEHLLRVIDNGFVRLEERGATEARVRSAEAKLALLSPREQDVLKGLIEGRANKVIANELDISPRTVEIYRAKLMDKLEVRSLSEALRIAFAAGLIEP